jgi:hypothetical protein
MHQSCLRIVSKIIDNCKGKSVEVDYLQVFELSIARKDGVSVQKVIYKQECSPISDSYYFTMIEMLIKMTIWAMNNEEYCTTLLPDEYS